MAFEMACCEAVICNEIKQGLDPRQIAMSYGLALRSSWPTDWKAVNTAILARWDRKTLKKIKKAAWDGAWNGVPFVRPQ